MHILQYSTPSVLKYALQKIPFAMLNNFEFDTRIVFLNKNTEMIYFLQENKKLFSSIMGLEKLLEIMENVSLENCPRLALRRVNQF